MTSWTAAAVLAVSVAVWTWRSAGGAHRLRGCGSVAAEKARHRWAEVGCASAAVASVVLAGGSPLALVFLGGLALVASVVRRLVAAWQARRRRRHRQLAVIELCDALSVELRGGLPVGSALERACADSAELAPVLSTSRLGGDVVAALHRAAKEPGAEGLKAVAAGWDVAGTAGATLAAVLERIAAGLRSDDDARAEVTACLGPVRATAKMLAVLPVFGVALGSSMGARPVAFLISTGPGLACLGAGLTLASAGVLWVERLAAAAEV